MRADKLALAALEASLALHADPARARAELPTLAMLSATPEALRARAERLASGLRARVPALVTAIVKGEGEVGGGSLPLQKLPGPVVAVTHPKRSAAALEQLAREAEPPVIGTVRAGAFRLDPRTLSDEEVELAAAGLAAVWGREEK